MLTGFSFAHAPRELGVPRRGFYVPRPRQLTLNPGMSPADKDYSMTVIRTERGSAAHSARAGQCRYHRNTLLQCGNSRYVVSTIGDCRLPNDCIVAVGIQPRRYYESKAFRARREGICWNADPNRAVEIEGRWAIVARTAVDLPCDDDSHADAMHEAAVEEIAAKLLSGLLS